MKLLWFVSTLEDTNFLKEFSRFFKGDIEVFHLNYITPCDLLTKGFKSYFPRVSEKHRFTNVDVSRTFNVLAGRLTTQEAQLAYSSTMQVLNRMEFSRDYVFVLPSGRHVHHVAATTYAKDNGISRLYINYANFPGYVFFDSEGTDCLSSLYRDPSRLDRLYPEEVDVDGIFKYFSDLKEKQNTIPQAVQSKFKVRLKEVAFKIDSVLQRAFGLYGDRRIPLISKKTITTLEFQFDEIVDFSNSIFFPMQVSTDQQVLMNYDGGSIYSAIDEAVGIANKKKKTLIIREHPAESKKIEMRRYLDLMRSKYCFVKVVCTPVPKLLDVVGEVITINSTVGLEARLKGKTVTFLGKSFYSKANDQQIAKYLSRYFIPIDYHKPVMDEGIVNRILQYSNSDNVL
ncbi:MAG: hypothetical protein VB954_00030 [Thalassolituus sp.]|uniref:capsular polysaccharide export protein, LipB/KpsS family n=1 Tax=Thalassolituus sp. TaxID=2030822 RepID=UPI003981ABCD